MPHSGAAKAHPAPLYPKAPTALGFLSASDYNLSIEMTVYAGHGSHVPIPHIQPKFMDKNSNGKETDCAIERRNAHCQA